MKPPLSEREKRKKHNISKLIGFYEMDNDNRQKVLICIAKNHEEDTSTLIIAFRGSEDYNDWIANLQIDLVDDDDMSVLGKFHKGFHKIASRIVPSEIIELALQNDVDGILTCGHSLGGAISSIFHMKLRNCYKTDLEEMRLRRRNIVNMTFGAPMFGNASLQQHGEKNDHWHKMFHFASVQDIVPGILSFGHTCKVVKERVSKATAGISDVIIDWTKKHADLALKNCDLLLEALFGDKMDVANDLIKKLKESLPPSTLQNDYHELDFAPIGQFIFLGKGKKAEISSRE